MLKIVRSWFDLTGLRPDWSNYAAIAVSVLLILGVSLLANFIVKRVILVLVKKIVAKTKNKRDDIVYKRGVLTRLSRLAPALIIYFLVRMPFSGMPAVITVVQKIASGNPERYRGDERGAAFGFQGFHHGVRFQYPAFRKEYDAPGGLDRNAQIRS